MIAALYHSTTRSLSNSECLEEPGRHENYVNRHIFVAEEAEEEVELGWSLGSGSSNAEKRGEEGELADQEASQKNVPALSPKRHMVRRVLAEANGGARCKPREHPDHPHIAL